jgi:hypothetical protein
MPAQEIGRGHTERRPGVEDSSGEKRVKTERCLAERQGDEDRSEERRAKAKADKMAVKFQKREARARRVSEAAEEKLALLEQRLATAICPGSEGLVMASVDVEAWEGNPRLVTEIGLAFFVAVFGHGSTFRHRHIIVEEHLGRRNGKWVEDNRDRFLFGDSEVLPLANAVAEVSKELDGADYIIGHAVAGDLKWLHSIGVRSKQRNSQGAEEVTLDERLVDTQMLDIACVARAARAIGGRKDDVKAATKQRSLKVLAEEHGLHPAALHNGANDAAFTLQVMLSQCGVPFVAPPRLASSHLSQAPFITKQVAPE